MNPALPSRDLTKARQRLIDHVSRAMTHLRAHAGMRAGLQWLAICSMLLPVMILLQKLFSLHSLGINIYMVWGILVVLGLPYILHCMLSRKIHETLAATLADERLGLHSRLSTAMALDVNDPTGFSAAFYDEAYDKLRLLDPVKAFPWRTPKISLVIPFMLIASFAIWYLVPQQDKLGFKAKAEARALKEMTVKTAGTKLSQQLQELTPPENKERDERPGDQKLKQFLKKASEIAQQAKEGKLTPEETVLAMDPLKKEIQNEKDRLSDANKDFKDRLQKLADKDLNMEEGDLTREISEALKDGDLEKAAEQMRNLARKMKHDILENPNLTQEQKEEQLNKLKQEAEKLASALAEQEDLKKDLQEISKKSMSAKEYEQLQNSIKEQMEKDGKKTAKQVAQDLEDALNNAADEMEEVANEEKEMTEEEQAERDQLDKLENALDEAGEQATNGEEQMGEDGQQGQQGQQGQGQQGKGKGKEKQKGSQAGQSGKGQKQGQQGGTKRMASRQNGQSGQQGGKDGRQQQQQGGEGGNKNKDGPVTAGPSGPNDGGRGAGKRAYRDGDAEFEKQKLKGKIQSGSITGLTHFKGQGIKGDAPTEFKENFAAAEQEANASMELDRIPADTREMIKNYFLSVKKDNGMGSAPPPPPGTQGGATATPEPEKPARTKLQE
jgi:hypothetical protein